jgi:hypothetical protein
MADVTACNRIRQHALSQEQVKRQSAKRKTIRRPQHFCLLTCSFQAPVAAPRFATRPTRSYVPRDLDTKGLALKSEVRNPNPKQAPSLGMRTFCLSRLGHSDFVSRICFELRISSFGFVTSAWWSRRSCATLVCPLRCPCLRPHGHRRGCRGLFPASKARPSQLASGRTELLALATPGVAVPRAAHAVSTVCHPVATLRAFHAAPAALDIPFIRPV